MEIITRAEAKAKGLKRYFTGKPCKHSHISERNTGNLGCIACVKIRSQKNRDNNPLSGAEYYKKNKERMQELRAKNKVSLSRKRKEYYLADIDRLRAEAVSRYHANRNKNIERTREYRKNNSEKIKKQAKLYREENNVATNKKRRDTYAKNPIKFKDQAASWRRENHNKSKNTVKKWNNKNPIPIFIRCALCRIFTNWKGGRAKAEALHGYTFENLISHIESQFVDGMSWSNRSEWHIDHIKPISLFIKEGVTCPAIINALSNLQPLWAKDNLSKGAKYVENKA